MTAIGIALAAAMLSSALVLAIGLGQGFARSARAADLPDLIVRFDPQPLRRVAARIHALPDIAAFSTRAEFTGVGIGADGHRDGDASIEVVGAGRRGYAIVAGHDVSARFGEVVIERGLAQAWNVHLGQRLRINGLGSPRVVGFAEAPDDVGYPLAVPRVYVSRVALDSAFGGQPDPPVNVAEIWLRDPRYLNEVLVQARTTSYGLRGVRIITRSGVRVLLDQAAGIVIDLLVVLSLFALATAGVMLAASARAEIQRRLKTIGISRAVGASRVHLVVTQAREAAVLAVAAATVGLVAGVLATIGAADRLLIMLNELPTGAGLILPLAAGWLISISIPVLATAWPAWRAAGRPPVALLQGAGLDARRRHRPRRRASHRAGLATLGARLVAARRSRLAATVLTLGASTAFVLLLLALASALSALETDPAALGKRYQLTASLPANAVGQVRAIPGVQDAAPRYEVQAVDSFSLGETIDVIAYPGNHTTFEAPPLTSGKRLRGTGEAEVGAGLADALGLGPGSTLAIALPAAGKELRLRVAGVVSSLDHDGRVAYIPAAPLLKADPEAPENIAVRLHPGADQAAVSAALTKLGALPTPASGATARGVPLVDTLRTILRVVAIVDGLVCLYALIQTCAITLQERRSTVAVLRATGAGFAAVSRLLIGVVLALVIPAAVLGILLERLVLGPALANLAVNYATLELGAGLAQIAAVVVGLLAASAIAVLWVTRRATTEAVVQGLGG